MIMVNYSIFCKSKRWPRRQKKIDRIIKNILVYKKDMKFIDNIDYNCNFILANDEFMKKLNYKYKKKYQSTDVLTFISNLKIKEKKDEKHCDIILSIETILKDSKKNNVDFYNHITHLIIHSFLHINNFIHDKISDFLIMKKVEINILKKMGIESPY